MDIKIISIMCGVFGLTVGAVTIGLVMGKIAKTALDGMTRQPETSGTLFTTMIIAMALAEALVIYTLVVALILIVANPLV